jgi:hypothetical protein
MEAKGLWRIKCKEGHLNAALLYPLKLKDRIEGFNCPDLTSMKKRDLAVRPQSLLKGQIRMVER